MGLFNLKPARAQAKQPEVICDLDALIAEPKAFKFQGRTFIVNPIKTSELFKVTRALDKMTRVAHSSEIKDEVLLDAYLELFQSVIVDFKRDHLMDMTQAQCRALHVMILKLITGEPMEKKTPEMTNPSIPTAI